MISSTIKIDKRTEALEKNMKELMQTSLAIGVVDGSGTYKSGDSVVDVATMHEFGAPHKNVPQRSFLRAPFIHEKRRVNAVIDKSFEALADGRVGVKIAYEVIGVEARNIVIQAFQTSGFGEWTPNKPSTVSSKGSSKPLIDTGRLMQSITWEVRRGK